MEGLEDQVMLDSPDIRAMIEEVRSVIDRLERMTDRSTELDRAHERLIEADLWLKRHGNRGRLGE